MAQRYLREDKISNLEVQVLHGEDIIPWQKLEQSALGDLSLPKEEPIIKVNLLVKLRQSLNNPNNKHRNLLNNPKLNPQAGGSG